MKYNRLFLMVMVLFSILFLYNNIAFKKIMYLPNDFYVSYDEVYESNKRNSFGKLVDIHLVQDEIKTGDERAEQGEIIFKLFGILPIKKVNVKILPEEEVYVGGTPMGLALHSNGVVVVSNSMILAESGKIIKNQYLNTGDVITQINDKEIHCIEDLENIVSTVKEDNLNVKFLSKNQVYEREIGLIKDSEGNYKMGLWVKDDFSGVGTLSFVKKTGVSYQFGALGHPITNGQNENIIPISTGEVYSCSLVDIAKGEKNNPGELRCVFVEKNKQGEFNKNTNVGIFGQLENVGSLIDINKTAILGGRLSVKPGKAKIVSKVSGMLEEYEIEIIKTSYQTEASDKSIVFRVVDKRLLELTGGIVQGMSGSPIMQDGKIVGAVTHVFVSDPTKGFGVYSDWMLEQLN